MNWKKFLWFVAPLVVYAVLVFYLSSLPTLKQPQQYLGFEAVSDKLLHAAEFFVLAFLLLRWLYNTKYREYAFHLAILAAVLYGLIDELHQHFVPGRAADLLDFLSDCAGALLILVFSLRIRTLRKLLTLGASSNRRTS